MIIVGNAISMPAFIKVLNARCSTILKRRRGIHPMMEVFLIPMAIERQNATRIMLLSNF